MHPTMLSFALLASAAFVIGGPFPVEATTLTRVGLPRHNEQSPFEVRSRAIVEKRSAPLLDTIKADSLSPVGGASYFSCGQADIVFGQIGQDQALTLVLLDPSKATATFKSSVSTLKSALTLNAYASYEVTISNGEAFQFSLPVPARYGFDVYAYYKNGTGGYTGVGTRRVASAESGSATCIVTCRRDSYVSANKCIKCSATYGTNVLTCDSSSAKTCNPGYSVKNGRCLLNSEQSATSGSVVTTTTGTRRTTATTTTIKTSSTTTAASVPTADSAVKRLALKEHNDFRVARGAKALVWDDTLAAFAQTVADKCVFAHSGYIYGENLAAYAGDPSKTIVDGIKLWENEESEFNCANPVYSHFTQMVWRSTSKLGCAEANCSSNTIFSQ